MPNTRRQKAKARRSSEADILSDMENTDVLLGIPDLAENRFDFDSMSEWSHGQNERQSRKTNSQEIENRKYPGNSNHNNISVESANNLRDEMNFRILQEMNGLMNTLNTQIQEGISQTIDTQFLPRIQNTIRQVQNANANNRKMKVRCFSIECLFHTEGQENGTLFLVSVVHSVAQRTLWYFCSGLGSYVVTTISNFLRSRRDIDQKTSPDYFSI